MAAAPGGVRIRTKLIFCVSLHHTWLRARLVYYCQFFSPARRFLNHVLQGHIERYVYIFIHYTLRYAEAAGAQLFFSPFFLRWVSQTNAGWQVTNKET